MQNQTNTYNDASLKEIFLLIQACLKSNDFIKYLLNGLVSFGFLTGDNCFTVLWWSLMIFFGFLTFYAT